MKHPDGIMVVLKATLNLVQWIIENQELGIVFSWKEIFDVEYDTILLLLVPKLNISLLLWVLLVEDILG